MRGMHTNNDFEGGYPVCVDKADPPNYNLFKQKFLRVG